MVSNIKPCPIDHKPGRKIPTREMDKKYTIKMISICIIKTIHEL